MEAKTNIKITPPTFTADFFSDNIPNWERWLAPLKGQPDIRALEIGSYEGRSARWLLENILTDETSSLLCVDTWAAGQDLPTRADLLQVFRANTAPWRDRCHIKQGRSAEVLRRAPLPPDASDGLDFAYVDGSHYAADVLRDGVLVWDLMRAGGLVVFDDYEWRVDPLPAHQPCVGIDAFLAGYSGRYYLVGKGRQVAVRKLK